MRVEFVSDGQLFLHICVWMCDVGGLFICVYVFAHLYARERLFCPCVLMSVRQEIMCASLRERESVPRSCSAWVDEGGYLYTLTPAFGVPGWLSETISFLCGPFESLKCDANVRDRVHLHGPLQVETKNDQLGLHIPWTHSEGRL